MRGRSFVNVISLIHCVLKVASAYSFVVVVPYVSLAKKEGISQYEIFITLSIWILGIFIVRYINTCLENYLSVYYNDFRQSENRILLNSIMEISYEHLEKSEYLDAYQKALNALRRNFTGYPVSIRNNVTLNSEDSSSLHDLYEQVDICDLISSLENGDQTIMSAEFKDATVFSGGQKLKLLLARIMYNDAHILILDEPSAALDPLAEFEFYDLFQNISAQKTSIYISHRMLATKFCSRVLVFDNGHIIEDGSFEELLHNDGLFRKMYMSQSSVFQQEN